MSHTLANDPTTAIRVATERIEPGLIEIRRDIHAHPELAFQEVRDLRVVAREPDPPGHRPPDRRRQDRRRRADRGWPPRQGAGDARRHGRAADRGARDLPFASQTKGLMHACGFDIHTLPLAWR